MSSTGNITMDSERGLLFYIVVSGLYLTVTGQEKRQCDMGWTLQRDTCFAHFLSPLSWNEAADHCRSLDAQLVSIGMQETQMFLQDMVRYSGQDIWLGLHYSSKHRGWVWVDRPHTALTYQNWLPSERNRTADEGRCGCMVGRQILTTVWSSVSSRARMGMWMRAGCNMEKTFVCQKPPVSYRQACQRGWYMYANSCFHGYQVPMTWIMARQACRQSEADLLVITSHDVQLFVNSMIIERPANYWVGLHYNRHEEKWCWLDTISEAIYTNWVPSSPDSDRVSRGQECMYLIGQNNVWTGSSDPVFLGSWNHDMCERKLLFFCQKRTDFVKVSRTDSHKPERVTVGPDSTTSSGQDVVSTDEVFLAVNVPVSLVVITVIVIIGVLLAFLYIKRPGCLCTRGKQDKTVGENYNGLENPDSQTESDYATIGDVIATGRSNSIPIANVRIVPCGRESRSVPNRERRRATTGTDRVMKKKQDAVVSEFKRQRRMSDGLHVKKISARSIHFENVNTLNLEGETSEVEDPSYLDLCVEETDRSDRMDVDNKDSNIDKTNRSDMSDDVSFYDRTLNTEDVCTDLKARTFTDKPCIEQNEYLTPYDDGYETPVRCERDMYLELCTDQGEGESKGEHSVEISDDDGDWDEDDFEDEEGFNHSYEEPVR